VSALPLHLGETFLAETLMLEDDFATDSYFYENSTSPRTIERIKLLIFARGLDGILIKCHHISFN